MVCQEGFRDNIFLQTKTKIVKYYPAVQEDGYDSEGNMPYYWDCPEDPDDDNDGVMDEDDEL